MAATFTASTYLSTTNVPGGINQNSAVITLALWVYCTSTGGLGVFGSDGSVGMYIGIAGNYSGSTYPDFVGLINYTGYNPLDLNRCSDNYSTGDTDVPDSGLFALNAWHHVAATFNSSNTTLYVDGAVSATGTGTTGTAKPWVRLIVGGFTGDAQDAVCYNRILTATEIKNLYRSRRPSIDMTSVIGFWPLASGGSAGVDFSGNGRTLTATGTVSDATRSAPVSWSAGRTNSALRR